MFPYELISMHEQVNRYSVVEENFDLSPADVATILILDKETFKYNLYVIVRSAEENHHVSPINVMQNCKPLDYDHAKIFYPHLESISYGFTP